MSRVLVSGSLAYDRIMNFAGLFREHFLADKLHNINVSFAVDTFSENFGGTAGNIAYNLALLGEPSTIIAHGGSDFERYANRLRSLQIDPASIHIDAEKPTSSAFIMTDQADNQIAAFSLGAGGNTYSPLPETKGFTCAIIGAGSAPDMQALPKHYRATGVQYFYDPGQQLPVLSGDDLRDGISGAAALYGNDYEINLIMQKTGWSETEIVEHAQMLVVTLGEKGSRIITTEKEVTVPAVSVANVVDPTGAGDAYRAGFIRGFLAGLSPDVCAKVASTVAAYAVETYGTQNHTFTEAHVKERYQKAYGENLAL